MRARVLWLSAGLVSLLSCKTNGSDLLLQEVKKVPDGRGFIYTPDQDLMDAVTNAYFAGGKVLGDRYWTDSFNVHPTGAEPTNPSVDPATIGMADARDRPSFVFTWVGDRSDQEGRGLYFPNQTFLGTDGREAKSIPIADGLYFETVGAWTGTKNSFVRMGVTKTLIPKIRLEQYTDVPRRLAVEAQFQLYVLKRKEGGASDKPGVEIFVLCGNTVVSNTITDANVLPFSDDDQVNVHVATARFLTAAWNPQECVKNGDLNVIARAESHGVMFKKMSWEFELK